MSSSPFLSLRGRDTTSIIRPYIEPILEDKIGVASFLQSSCEVETHHLSFYYVGTDSGAHGGPFGIPYHSPLFVLSSVPEQALETLFRTCAVRHTSTRKQKERYYLSVVVVVVVCVVTTLISV
jgi:hypothetical protein